MPVLRRGGVYYVRITHQSRQLWRSLKTTARPSAATVAAAEAELWAEAGARRPAPARPTTPALQAVADYLGSLAANQRSPGHRARVADVLGRAAAAIGSEDLAGWTRQAIERFLRDGLTGSGWAANRKPGARTWKRGRTANLNKSVIRAFLRWAQNQELLPAGEVATRRIADASEDGHQPVSHDRRMIVRILRAVREYDGRLRRGRAPWLERCVRVALGTGARRSELENLAWSGVDFRANRIRLFGKSREERVIPMARVARDALLQVPEEQRRGRVFGSLEEKSNLPLTRALRTKGLPAFGWRTFRHTYCTALIRAGVPLPVVKELAGHADIKTTMRYVHVTSKDLEVAAERLPW